MAIEITFFKKMSREQEARMKLLEYSDCEIKQILKELKKRKRRTQNAK